MSFAQIRHILLKASNLWIIYCILTTFNLEKCEVGGSDLFFCKRKFTCPSIIYWNHYSFPNGLCWPLFKKKLTWNTSFFLKSQGYSVVLYASQVSAAVLITVSAVSLEVKTTHPETLFFFNNVSAILGLLYVHVNFELVNFREKKKPARILTRVCQPAGGWRLHRVVFAFLHVECFCLYLELFSYFSNIRPFSVY